MKLHHYPEEKPHFDHICLIKLDSYSDNSVWYLASFIYDRNCEPVWVFYENKDVIDDYTHLSFIEISEILDCCEVESVSKDSLYRDSNKYFVESIQKNDSGEYIATVRSKPITKKLRLTEERAGGAFSTMRSNICFNFKISEVIEE